MVEASIARLGIPDPKAGFPVHHFGYLDDERQQRKLQYYYELGKKKLSESGGAPDAIVELAIQAAAVKRYDEAIELWQRALVIDPDSSLAYFNLGHCFLQKGMFAEGRAACQRALALKENYREALINLLTCELCLGNDEALLAPIEAAMVLNADYPLLPLMRGIVLAVLGRNGEAQQEFRSLLDDKIEFSKFISEVSLKLIEAGRNEASAALAECARLVGVNTLEK
jgi:tetratricopeptide (TPR) repeat protein